MTTTSEYSGKAITRAGRALMRKDLAMNEPQAFEDAMNILSFWRSAHEVPLEAAYRFLSTSANKIDKHTVLAKRLKRTPSIVAKLQRFERMPLRTMQDIGGCRAILSNQKQVAKLARELKKRMPLRIKQYVKKPKKDGYRGIHLIGNFSSNCHHTMPIEIQLRTTIQHSWATAVEINDLFTGQAIKSNRGTDEWKSFFRCVADAFSSIEKLPQRSSQYYDEIGHALATKILRGDTELSKEQLIESCKTVYILSDRLNVFRDFDAYANSLTIADDQLAQKQIDGYVLLNIDAMDHSVVPSFFHREHFSEASDAYLAAEKAAARHDHQVVALVSTDAVGGIKEAYPNYFADSTKFLRLLRATTEAHRRINPSIISRAFQKWR